MIKLIVTDLDNTLLDKDGRVREDSISLIEEAADRGIVFAVATGRSFASAKAIAMKFASDIPVICYNGAQIKMPVSGEIVYESIVDEKLQDAIIDFAIKHELYVQVYDNDEIVVEELDLKAHPDPDLKFTGYRETHGMEALKGIKTPKILLATSPKLVPAIQNELENEYGDIAYFAQSEAHLIEVMNKGVNKGIALDKLASILNIERDEIMALGDNTNDLLLLEHAGTRISVANGVEKLKKIATYVCTKERADGFNEAIRKFVLNKE